MSDTNRAMLPEFMISTDPPGFLDEMADAGWVRPIVAVLRLDVDRRLDLYHTFDATLGELGLPVFPVEIPARTAAARQPREELPIARWRPDFDAGLAYYRFASGGRRDARGPSPSPRLGRTIR